MEWEVTMVAASQEGCWVVEEVETAVAAVADVATYCAMMERVVAATVVGTVVE